MNGPITYLWVLGLFGCIFATGIALYDWRRRVKRLWAIGEARRLLRAKMNDASAPAGIRADAAKRLLAYSGEAVSICEGLELRRVGVGHLELTVKEKKP